MAEVRLDGVRKKFGSVTAVEDFTLSIGNGEFVVFVGPSGCGKSTTLRMLAGLEDASAGSISIDGRTVNNIHPKDRDIAMVFQNYALYPHLNVFDNMSFGLRAKRLPRQEIEFRTREAANILGLDDLLKRRPGELSGGQKQRVAMGRAIVRQPKVFLFDEPLSNLDAKLRHKMRVEMKLLHQRVTTTTVYVTHDQVEAMTLADRIVIMNEGRIEQVGTPDEVYKQPVSQFVASFIGSPAMNFMTCKVVQNGELILDEGKLKFPVPENMKDKLGKYKDQQMIVGIRPEDIHSPETAYGVEKKISVQTEVDVVEPMGNEIFVYLNSGFHNFTARLETNNIPKIGNMIDLIFNLEKIHFFDKNTEASIN